MTLITGDRIGLLDGSSKHVVLAQYPDVSWNEVGTGWKDARVRGAGEIIVDLRDNCSYTITDSSGTYRPNDLANLKRIAKRFAEKFAMGGGLPVPPKYLKDKDQGLVFYDIGLASTSTLECPR